MGAAGGDGTAWTIHGSSRACIDALASILVLAATALAGCTTHGATGSAGSTEIEGGVGLSGAGDDGAAPLPVSRDGGTTDHAAATIDSGQGGHEICSQSWRVLANDPSDPRMGVAQAGARMLALDGVGNMVVAASFTGAVNVAGQTFQSAGSGAESLLVVKVDPACRVLWAKAFGASQADVQVAGVAADAAGNVVVAGQLTGAQVDFGSGPVGSLVSPRPGAFVFELGPDGKGLWSHAYLASAGSFLISGYDVGVIDVAVDAHGNTVFAAYMACPARAACNPGSVDFGGGAVTFAWSLVELDANGQFVFAVDASHPDTGVYFEPYSLTTDAAGRIWAAGIGDQLEIVAFDAGGHQQWVRNVSDAFIQNQWKPMVRVDANDDVFTAVAWVQQTADGGSLDDTPLSKFSPTGSPSWTPPAAIPEAARGPQDPGFGTVNANPWWAAWPGGRLAVDPSGRALVSSAFTGSADFGSVGSLTSVGGLDSAVLRFDAQGHLIGGQRWGGADDDLPVDVAVDAAGDAVIAGWSVPPVGLDAGSGVSQSSASYAIFVAKLGW